MPALSNYPDPNTTHRQRTATAATTGVIGPHAAIPVSPLVAPLLVRRKTRVPESPDFWQRWLGCGGVSEGEPLIAKWASEWNHDPKSFIWTKTADDIFETLAAYCERINNSGH
jgi:hypothetical protein